jgi:hypothetical protein
MRRHKPWPARASSAIPVRPQPEPTACCKCYDPLDPMAPNDGDLIVQAGTLCRDCQDAA